MAMGKRPAYKDREKKIEVLEGALLEANRGQGASGPEQERYRIIAENTNDGIYINDFEGDILYVNANVCRMLGYSQEEIIGANLAMIDPDWSLPLQGKLEELVQKGSCVFERRNIRKDGSEIIVEVSSRIISHDGKGTAVSFVRDATLRKQLENELWESKEKLLHLTDNLSNVVVYQLTALPDGSRRFTYISRAVERLNEVKEEDVLKDAGLIYGQVLPEYREMVREREEEALGNRTQLQVEVQCRLPSGRLRWFFFSSTPRLEKDGILLWDGVEVDITERKRTEDEQLKIHKLESIGTLAGGIAHDFNNLLAVMQGYVDLLKTDTTLGNKAYSRLIAVDKAVRQAIELTNHLITFAKGGDPIKEVVSLGDIVKEEVLRNLTGLSIEKRFYLENDLWPVAVDIRQIRQVIRNLVINAVEAMPEAGRLTVRAENTTVQISDGLPIGVGAYVCISVEDTGKGISKDQMPYIFDLYYSTKQRGEGKGTGLGLSVCQSVIVRHKGYLGVESTEGIGSIFRIYLPRSFHKEMPVGNRLSLERVADKESILVMDDEIMIRNLATDVLTSMGYNVETAKDGLEAINLYVNARNSGHPYKLVILDLMVPGGMDGKTTMERLQMINSDVRGIIISGYSDDPIIQNYRQYGFVGALTKPFDMKSLQKILEDYL